MTEQQQRFRFAKHRYTRAIEAFLRGDRDAPELCEKALAELAELAKREAAFEQEAA